LCTSNIAAAYPELLPVFFRGIFPVHKVHSDEEEEIGQEFGKNFKKIQSRLLHTWTFVPSWKTIHSRNGKMHNGRFRFLYKFPSFQVLPEMRRYGIIVLSGGRSFRASESGTRTSAHCERKDEHG